ncbi:uridine phosphorylase 1-like [Haemaphysalis longicornis]
MLRSSSSPDDKKKNAHVELRNPNLKRLKDDYLYHLALSTRTHNFKEMFGDVKYVCMGGTDTRMERFAHLIKTGLDIQLPSGSDLYDISQAGSRYALYKAGPVLSVSHGMGAPSFSIVMHEILKLLHYAECTDVVMMRLGTSGGVGVPPGTVVVTTNALNGLLQEHVEMFILGELVHRPCVLDAGLVDEIVDVGRRTLPLLNIVKGKTMSTSDFYEGQARLDGAVCTYTKDMKHKFMEKIRDIGVVNIEMEAAEFAAMCHHAGVKGAVVCVTLLDRLEGDQIDADHEKMVDWQNRPQELALQFICSRLDRAPANKKTESN